jgi:DNA replication and repair protein RecF
MRRGAKAYTRLSEHIGFIPLVMISPDDNMLVSGESSERRRFLDAVIAQTSAPYLDALTEYAKALQQRNALLKMEDEPDPTLLSLWEEEMARHGEYIYRSRRDFIEQFIPVFQSTYETISRQHETVSLSYVSHGDRGSLLDTIRDGRSRDRAVGYSLHGVHRDDLDMTVDGYPLRREASLGQKRTMVLSMKLAQFDFLRQSGSKTTPILLLDDIFDRLDARRVEQIIALVSSERFGQTFITDTNRDHLDRILSATSRDHRLFTVEGGEVH